MDPVDQETVEARYQRPGRLSRRGRVALGGVGVLALTVWLFTRRSEEGSARSAQRAYGRPIVASLLIALMALWWLAPKPPVLFYEALLILVPIPAATLAACLALAA